MSQGQGESGSSAAGTAIDPRVFRALADDYKARIKRGDDFTDDDYVTMVKLFNTIESHGLGARDEALAQYRAAFFPDLVERVTHRLEMLPTKGMALYSEGYNVYLGGPPYAPSRY